MRKLFVIASISFFICGCVSVEYNGGKNPSEIVNTSAYSSAKKSLTNIDHVYLSMSKQEVEVIMGKEIKIGYLERSDNTGIYDPIKIKSPYRIEQVVIKNKQYDVQYYYYRNLKQDGIVSEDELMPLVFEKDKLIGQGQDFLFKLKQKLNS